MLYFIFYTSMGSCIQLIREVDWNEVLRNREKLEGELSALLKENDLGEAAGGAAGAAARQESAAAIASHWCLKY